MVELMDEERLERVLSLVESIPAGQVVAYGDVAMFLDLGPRQVGAVLSCYGGSVPWWRVTNARGELPLHLLDEARQHWRDEGITLAASGRRCRIDVHRADLGALPIGGDDTIGV